MKKQSIYALMSAIALSGAIGFSSCSSSKDDVGEVNPNFNPQTNEVKTQFVLNVSNGNQASTRQSEAATQALTTSAFRGIEDSWVMCAKQGTDGLSLSASTTIDKPINMARVAAAGTLSNENSRRVLEMTLPLNTNTILFYGRAVQNGSDHAAYNTYGHLDDYHVEANLGNVNFQLGRRLSADEKTKFQEVQRLLAAILSCIMETDRGTSAVAATDTPTGEGIPAYGFDLPADLKANMKWSAYNSMTTSPVDGGAIRMLESKLAKIYKELTTIQEAELRNASGYALKESAKQLWSIVNAVRCATPTDQAEALAKYMAQRIHDELLKYFTVESVPSNGAGVTGVAFKSAENLISALSSDTYWPATGDTKPTEFSHISGYTSANMAQFPEQFDLPQGSTHIKFDSTKKTFYYVTDYNSSAVGGGTFTVDDYYYPAELLYFGNSPIRVSNTEHSVTDYPKTVNLWNTDWPSDWSIGHVQSSTRSVAMKNDINYGSSLLQMTVGYAVTTLKDNNHAIQERDYGITTEVDNDITVDGTSFKLVGVIVGDQWPKVGWNFLPKTTGDANYRKGYIYDRDITNNGVIPAYGSTSEANYTLVFDNYQDMRATDATNKQPKVYIALEFQNNTGKDFFGKDNLIANGSHFYLIGELDPAGKSGPALPEYHALPPYDAGCTTNTIPRVFIQDHTTKVNFKIGVNSLKYAYLTVPDLRSSSVTLGLSVDMSWSEGLKYTEDNSVILGGN